MVPPNGANTNTEIVASLSSSADFKMVVQCTLSWVARWRLSQRRAHGMAGRPGEGRAGARRPRFPRRPRRFRSPTALARNESRLRGRRRTLAAVQWPAS
jgi:hypothetical protein